MGILLKDILLEIKVRRPGIKFPIKIEDQQDWDTWSKILRDEGWVWAGNSDVIVKSELEPWAAKFPFWVGPDDINSKENKRLYRDTQGDTFGYND